MKNVQANVSEEHGCKKCGCGHQDHVEDGTNQDVNDDRWPNRTADNTKWTAKLTLGFHGIPVGSRACKKLRYEAIKRSWAAVGRRSPWDLVMSMYSQRASPASSNGVGLDTRKTYLSAPLPWVVEKQLFDPWVSGSSLAQNRRRLQSSQLENLLSVSVETRGTLWLYPKCSCAAPSPRR